MGLARLAMGQAGTTPVILAGSLILTDSLILASCLICDRFFNASLFYYFIDQPIDQNFAQIIFGNENAKILAAKAIGRNKGKDWGLAFRA